LPRGAAEEFGKAGNSRSNGLIADAGFDIELSAIFISQPKNWLSALALAAIRLWTRLSSLSN
jgi:hypothetical protein